MKTLKILIICLLFLVNCTFKYGGNTYRLRKITKTYKRPPKLEVMMNKHNPYRIYKIKCLDKNKFKKLKRK